MALGVSAHHCIEVQDLRHGIPPDQEHLQHLQRERCWSCASLPIDGYKMANILLLLQRTALRAGSQADQLNRCVHHCSDLTSDTSSFIFM